MIQLLRNGSRICACRVGCLVVCGDVDVQWGVSAGGGHVHRLWRRRHRDVLDRDRVNLHVSRCRISPAQHALRRTSIVFTWIKMHRVRCNEKVCFLSPPTPCSKNRRPTSVFCLFTTLQSDTGVGGPEGEDGAHNRDLHAQLSSV